jgi:hypothetical protein
MSTTSFTAPGLPASELCEVYLRDTTGTRKTPSAGSGPGDPTPVGPRHTVLSIDLYEPPIRLEYEAA